MSFDPKLAAVRFGTGLSAVHAPAPSPASLMKSIDGHIEKKWPMHRFVDIQPLFKEYRQVQRQKRKLNKGQKTKLDVEAINMAMRSMNGDLYRIRTDTARSLIGRGTYDQTGFSTKLTLFWADHFTVHGKNRLFREMTGDYFDGAIRPNIIAKFEDMLAAVVTHPMMLNYLDQTRSVGPNSKLGKQNLARGINENFAREFLELHTLGVDGPYTQEDVLAVARLFTGLSTNAVEGFKFEPNKSEPGPHFILNKSYENESSKDLDAILALVKDVARHPATGRHLATKMARHFVSDEPDPALIDAMIGAYGSDGNLGAMTEALVSHPKAMFNGLGNVKWSAEYMMSVARAMNMPDDRLKKLSARDINKTFLVPMAFMSQPFFKPESPAGLEEDDFELLSPQSLAARLDWALKIPDKMVRGLPDPRLILPNAVIDAPESLNFAVKAAESRHEGLAMIFISPAFQRR